MTRTLSKLGDAPFKLRLNHIRDGGESLAFELDQPLLASYLAEVDNSYKVGERNATFDLGIARVGTNVFVKGFATVPYRFTCSRCVEDKDTQLDLNLKWTFLPLTEYTVGHSNEEFQLAAEDLDVSFYEGDAVNLTEIVREAIMLEILPHPVCKPACIEGKIEASAGKEDESDAARIDPRWLPLMKIKEQQKS